MNDAINQMWSNYVQTPEMLDKMRELSFRDIYREPLLRLMRLEPGMKIVDLGCGPGTLTRKLAGWLGDNTFIMGVDRDSGMLEYANQKVEAMGLKNVTFLEDDVVNLQLPDNSMDACTSSAVMEHVEPSRFLKEQQRICKRGGVVSVLNNRTDRSIYAQPEPISEGEKELWNPLHKNWVKKDKERGVAAYALKPFEIVKLFEETGFTDIQVDGIAFQSCIDDHRNSLEDKLAVWESERQFALDGIRLGVHQMDEPLPEGYAAELEKLVEERMNRRRQLILDGKKIWDFSITLCLIVSGVKV